MVAKKDCSECGIGGEEYRLKDRRINTLEIHHDLFKKEIETLQLDFKELTKELNKLVTLGRELMIKQDVRDAYAESLQEKHQYSLDTLTEKVDQLVKDSMQESKDLARLSDRVRNHRKILAAVATILTTLFINYLQRLNIF